MATMGTSSGVGGSSLGESGLWFTSSVMNDEDPSPSWSAIQEGMESSRFSKSLISDLLHIHYEERSERVLTELRARKGGMAR